MYQFKDTDRIFIYTGPEGAGRRTVADRAGETFSMKKVVAYTTRTRRPNETEGVDYFYLNPAQFKRAELNNEFVETIFSTTNLYGIKGADIEEHLSTHGAVYLIMNREGAEILKGIYGDKVVRIFVYSDVDTVKKRQVEKGLSEESIARNIVKYNEDMAYMPLCEHAFENYDLSHTLFSLTKILEGYLKRDLLDLD